MGIRNIINNSVYLKERVRKVSYSEHIRLFDDEIKSSAGIFYYYIRITEGEIIDISFFGFIFFNI